MAKQTIAVLLRKDPVDWGKVKKRAESHPNEINRTFIHKLCLKPSVPPLFLDWVLKQAPQAQLLRKSGLQFPGKMRGSSSTPLELCLRDNGSRVPHSTFSRIVQATHKVDSMHCPFESVDFLEFDLDNLRVLLETYEPEDFGEDAFEKFLIHPLVNKTWDWGDMNHENEKITRLELVLRAASRLLGCERTSKGVFSAAHTFIVTAYSIDTNFMVLPSALYHFLKRIIGCVKPREFCAVDDQEGNTLLHYIIQYTAREDIPIHTCSCNNMAIDEEDRTYTGDNYEGDSVTNRYWLGLINMLLREQQERQPASALSSLPTMMVNKKGQTPLHIALLHGLPYITALVHPTEDDIMYQGLYPFQLAGTACSSDNRECPCCRCRKVAEEKEAAILTNTYSLLRMKPHLLSSTLVENEDSTALLDSPEYKELVMKELQVARMSREIKMVRKRRREGLDNEQPRRRVLAKAATKA